MGRIIEKLKVGANADSTQNSVSLEKLIPCINKYYNFIVEIWDKYPELNRNSKGISKPEKVHLYFGLDEKLIEKHFINSKIIDHLNENFVEFILTKIKREEIINKFIESNFKEKNFRTRKGYFLQKKFLRISKYKTFI